MDEYEIASKGEQTLDERLLDSLRPMAVNLPESGIMTVIHYSKGKPDLVEFWAGEGDVPTPNFIMQAAIDSLHAGHTFYTHQRGIPPLRQAVANYLGRHFEIDLDMDRIVVTGSGMQALMHTMQAIAGPGDEVVVVAPVWPNIFSAIQMQEAVPRPVNLTWNDGAWRLDLDHLFDACGPRTRAFFINTPGNPTGWIMEPADMVRVRDYARARGMWIIADEVYSQFVYDRLRVTSFLEVMEPQDRLIVTNTFSKNWSMTGWRVGWVVIPQSEAVAKVFENLVHYNTSGVPEFLQHGCLAALNEGDGYVKQLVEQCRRGRDLVCERLASLPQVRLSPPQGAFYLFFKVDGESDSLALAKRMVDEANVGLAPGSAFGRGGEGYMRLCYAASHEILSKGVERLVAALG